MYRLSLCKNCTAGSLYYTLPMLELLNHNIEHNTLSESIKFDKWRRARRGTRQLVT